MRDTVGVVITAVAWLGLWLGAPEAVAVSEAGNALAAFVETTGRCPAEARHCFGLAVHVITLEGEPVVGVAWLRAQVAAANRLFAAIGVAFEVVRVEAEDGARADVVTRLDRDHLGRADFDRGVVHVYVVRSLADVDVPGEVIRGVHWRDRSGGGRRWIILSSIAEAQVLPHELGHFFGLPHSRYRESIMNKRPRASPPWPARVFAEPERAIMTRHRDAMIGDGSLTLRSTTSGSSDR